MNKKKSHFLLVCILVSALTIAMSGCDTDAQEAQQDISQSAGSFGVYRQVVFFDTTNREMIAKVTGFCGPVVDNSPEDISIVCKAGGGNTQYRKTILGRPEGISYLVIQLPEPDPSLPQYQVIIKPSVTQVNQQ